jgi:hypothetical protein
MIILEGVFVVIVLLLVASIASIIWSVGHLNQEDEDGWP